MRAYLEELGIPKKHDVHLDLERIRSLAVELIAHPLPAEELGHARLDLPASG